MAIYTEQDQQKAVRFVADSFSGFKTLMEDRMNDMIEIYKEYSTFKVDKKNSWDTTFKVNKANEAVNRTLPRIMAKNPTWIVSSRPDIFLFLNKIEDPEEKKQKLQDLEDETTAIQDYLTNIFDKYNQTEPARIWAKNMLIYGSAFARVDFIYEIGHSMEETPQDVPVYDASGQQIATKKQKVKKVKENVWGQYPSITPISFADLYYDPRYKLNRLTPGFVEYVNGVRLAQLKANKDKYINLDKLELFPDVESFTKDPAGYRERVLSICGIILPKDSTGVDKNALSMKTYYGWCDVIGEEKLYKIGVVNDVLCICLEEITQIPYKQIRCFEDTETNFGTGLVEPIIGLQQELNFKKNAGSVYINQGLYRSYFYNVNSGINPRDLIQKPGGIIPTTRNMDDVDKNFREMPHREINPSFFQEQNDFERQIQAATFSVDTSSPMSQQALTNTATGARIQLFEQNSVIDEIRKHFEEGLTEMAYMLLQATADNIEDNIVIRKQGVEGYWIMHKEAMNNAISKYEIVIETGSSAFDNIADRRDDAMAQWTISQQAAMAGVPVDMTEVFKNVLDQFEGKNTARFIKNPQMNTLLGGQQPMPMGGTAPGLPPQQPKMTDAAAQTQAIAQGGLTVGM